METVKYIVQIWDKDINSVGTFIFDKFEDLWCFVETYREHYEEPNNLQFDIRCKCE